MSSLEAAMLGDEGLVFGSLALVQLLQALMVLEQGLVEPLQVLMLLQHRLILALQGRLLDQQLRVLVHQGRALGVQRGILHLQPGRNTIAIHTDRSGLKNIIEIKPP